MRRIILGCAAVCAVQLILISLLVFILSELMPGDALTGRISPSITGERLREMRGQMGFDRPWGARYASWLSGIFKGDFGVSFSHKLPVAQLVGEKFGNTLLLGAFSFLICYALSVSFGVIAGRYRGSWPDRAVSSGSYALMSIPQAVLGILAIFIFGYTLKWLPPGGSVDSGVLGPLALIMSRLRHLILPALTQLVRGEVAAGQEAEYILSLRSRGVAPSRVFWAHILRNSLIPAMSLSGSYLAALLGGTALVETIFSYPGIGKLFVDSVLKRDYPTANFILLLTAFMAAAGTLLSDIIMNRLDPRIKML
ncbi:MAG: ABC transporter permease [Clostridiales bacterium]|jgi:peptide/nickel transport system permease protein|nr:ABC transporter permease [Clostridiales bacterium]